MTPDDSRGAPDGVVYQQAAATATVTATPTAAPGRGAGTTHADGTAVRVLVVDD